MSNLALESEPVITDQQTILDHLPVAIIIADKNGKVRYFNHEAEAVFKHNILNNTKVTELSEQFNTQDFKHAINNMCNKLQFEKNIYFTQKEAFYQLKMIKNPHSTLIDSTYNDNNDYYLLTFHPVNVNSSLVNEPSASNEPLAGKEPSANKKPFASQKSLACKNSSHTSVLKKNFKELKQFSRLSAMREISSSLADKLNQPLTAILSYTQAMQRLYQKDASAEEINKAMQRVVISAENAANIIRKVRSELKVNTLNYQMTSINDLIQESIHLTDLDNPTSNIKLITEYEGEFTALCIDKIQFRQVIFSLLNNAIDAVSDNSVHLPEIIIRTEKNAAHYNITISDNGPGLPDEIQSKLFEPFTTTKKNGIGIGLSMCRHIIDLHKGNISIQSSKQAATIVTILLPLNTSTKYCQ